MATTLPSFTYSGICRAEIRNGYWVIFFVTSGTLKMSKTHTADLYLHGGGGAGGRGYGGGGGGGGYIANHSGISVVGGTSYSIVVGAGGTANGGAGGSSSAFGKSVEGGKGGGNGEWGAGGAGGSGNGGNGHASTGAVSSAGGSNTVYAFNDSAMGLLYGGGGGGGAPDQGGDGAGGAPYGVKGRRGAAPNTGAGGGGGGYANTDFGSEATNGNPGGSGIVILRGKQDDQLPLIFNGTAVSELIFNGTKVEKIIYNGTELSFGGTYKPLDTLTLFDNGASCYIFTRNGYTRDNHTGHALSSDGELKYGSNYMQISAVGRYNINYVGTAEAIDLTDYKTLHVETSETLIQNTGESHIYVAAVPTKHYPGTAQPGVYTTFNNGQTSLTLDISSLKGKHYIVITPVQRIDYGVSRLKITKMYATK